MFIALSVLSSETYVDFERLADPFLPNVLEFAKLCDIIIYYYEQNYSHQLGIVA